VPQSECRRRAGVRRRRLGVGRRSLRRLRDDSGRGEVASQCGRGHRDRRARSDAGYRRRGESAGRCSDARRRWADRFGWPHGDVRDVLFVGSGRHRLGEGLLRGGPGALACAPCSRRRPRARRPGATVPACRAMDASHCSPRPRFSMPATATACKTCSRSSTLRPRSTHNPPAILPHARGSVPQSRQPVRRSESIRLAPPQPDHRFRPHHAQRGTRGPQRHRRPARPTTAHGISARTALLTANPPGSDPSTAQYCATSMAPVGGVAPSVNGNPLAPPASAT